MRFRWRGRRLFIAALRRSADEARPINFSAARATFNPRRLALLRGGHVMLGGMHDQAVTLAGAASGSTTGTGG